MMCIHPPFINDNKTALYKTYHQEQDSIYTTHDDPSQNNDMSISIHPPCCHFKIEV